MKKRMLALVMVAAMIAGCLVGCGKGKESSRKQEGGAALTGEKIKITSQLHGWGKDWLENAAEEFTYQTGIEVKIEWDALVSSNLGTILENAEMDKSDIYFASNIDYEKYLKAELIEDLRDFMEEKDDTEGGKSLNERMTQGQMRYMLDKDGSIRQGTVPITSSNFGIVYNVKMMNYLCHDVLGWEEGHDYPINTKELFEVVDALNAQTEAGKNKELLTYTQDGKSYPVEALAWSGAVGSPDYIWKSWFYQYIGEEKLQKYLAEQGEKPSILEDPGHYISYQTICDLIGLTVDDNGDVYPANSIPNCVSYNHTASQTQFFLGKSLMVPGASWIYTEMEASIQNEKDWGYMPVPWLSDDKGNPLVGEGVSMPKDEDGNYKHFTASQDNAGDAALISARSKNKDISKKFLRFLLSSEYLVKLAEDMQSCVAYECDYEKIENKTYWLEQVVNIQESCVMISNFSTNPMVKKGAMGFYQATEIAPYAELSLGTFGSVTKMVDSATGKELSAGQTPTGFAVSENVYKYVQQNFKAGRLKWHEVKRNVGL